MRGCRGAPVQNMPAGVRPMRSLREVGLLSSDSDFPCGRRSAYLSLLLLVALYLCAMIDRVIVNILVTPIQQEFGVGEFEMGLLLGPAFGVSYVLSLIHISEPTRPY